MKHPLTAKRNRALEQTFIGKKLLRACDNLRGTKHEQAIWYNCYPQGRTVQYLRERMREEYWKEGDDA